MLKPEEIEPLPTGAADPAAVERLLAPASVLNDQGEPVGVVLPTEWYENYRRLLKADDLPEGVLDPVPLDAQGRPVGLTTHKLLRQLRRVAAEREGREAA